MKKKAAKEAEAVLASRRRLLAGRENGNSRVAEYESLLDLFTLISFILIFAAFVYVAGVKGQNTYGSDVLPRIAREGSASATVFPEDLVLLVLYREEGIDKFMISKGMANIRLIENVNRKNILDHLENLKAVITSARKINLAIDDSKQEADRFVAIDIQSWLAKNNVQYKFYLSGSK